MEADDARAVIADLQKLEALTDWERGFLESVRTQLRTRPSASAAQTRVLVAMAKKYSVAFGLTTPEDALWC